MPFIVPILISKSENSIPIELCKTLPTAKERQECLIQLQKNLDHELNIIGGSFLAIVVAMVIVMIWASRK